MKFHLMKQAVIGPNVPMAVFDNLAFTGENNLKVILYVLQKGTVDPIDIANKLSITLSSVHSSLWFWADKGLILCEEENSDNKSEKKKNLTAQEILQISKTQPEVAVLVNQLQHIYGKALNERATNTFINLYLQESVPIEVILVLAVHFAPTHKGPAYTAKVILNLFEKKGITTADKAEEYLRVMEKHNQRYECVCKIFGMDMDKLTSSEKTIIDAWYERLQMSEEMIRRAYYRAGSQAGIRYCNGILKSWAQKGYKTTDDIQGLFIHDTPGNMSNGDDLIWQNMNKVPSFNKGD